MKDLGKYEIAHTYKHGKPYVLTPRENQIMEEAVMQLAKIFFDTIHRLYFIMKI